ncbi:hypothetical protein [Arthrobacter sp. CG_A4]|uniref:hypothetical protein n=1 Tax=Arthrobacter sp. CG_A4 TaxID=3071706 RepID=UPI002E059FBE|nr:hypothetical protein [Arthrobacter sp. CG_A4]
MTIHRTLALAAALPALLFGVAACAPPAATETTATETTAGTRAPEAAAGFGVDNAGARERIARSGLALLAAEGNVEHFHAHLDLIKDATPVPVPANIGISLGQDGKPDGISALHTHDTSGVIHIESPTAGQVFTLGQLLTEWGVLTGTGPPGSGQGPADGWTAYVNGARYDAGIRDLPLKHHDQIVVSFGATPATIPSSYEFPPNE